MTTATAFWVTEPGRGEIRPGDAARRRVPDDVLVRTLRSGVSRGTETLVFGGDVPESQHATMRAPFQEGDFPGPVKYGYLNVGVVERGPRGAGRADGVLPLPAPDGVRRAGRGRDGGARGGTRGPRGAGRDGRDRRQRAVGRPTADRRPGRGGRRGDGRVLRGAAARRDTGGERDAGRRGRVALVGGARAVGAGSLSPPTPRVVWTSWCTPRGPPRACRPRSTCWRRTARCSSSAGTATRRFRLAGRVVPLAAAGGPGQPGG